MGDKWEEGEPSGRRITTQRRSAPNIKNSELTHHAQRPLICLAAIALSWFGSGDQFAAADRRASKKNPADTTQRGRATTQHNTTHVVTKISPAKTDHGQRLM
jgi:hypothetical protein